MGQGVADRREAIAAYDAAGDGASPLFLAEARAAASEAWDAAAVARDAAAAERDAAALREQAAAEKAAELRLRIQAELVRVQAALEAADQMPFDADGASLLSGWDDKPPVLAEIIPSPDKAFEACEGAQQQLSSPLPAPLRTAAGEDSAASPPLPLGPHKEVHPPRMYKGVRLETRRLASNFVKCWAAKISVDGATHNLGVFETQEEAARAFDDEQRRLGRRHCNFPRQGELQALPGVHQRSRASQLRRCS